VLEFSSITRTCNVSNPQWDKFKFLTYFRAHSGAVHDERAKWSFWRHGRTRKIRIIMWGSNEVRLRFARELIFPFLSLLDVFFWSAWSLFVSISWQFRWAHDQSAKVLSNGAASAQEALGNYFPVRISYKFLISCCRGDSDLGLLSSWHLAQRMPQRSGRICFIQGVCHNFELIRALHGGILCTRCQELHRRQAWSPLQIDIRNLYYIRTEK